FQVSLQPVSTQTLLGAQAGSTLNVAAASNAPAAFVRLQISNLSARQANVSVLSRMLSNVGRVILVNVEPLLEARITGGGIRQLILYGEPGLSYQLQYSGDLSDTHHWKNWIRVPLTNLFQVIEYV